MISPTVEVHPASAPLFPVPPLLSTTAHLSSLPAPAPAAEERKARSVSKVVRRADALLRPGPADLLQAHPVTTRVNTLANNDPRLIERALQPEAGAYERNSK